jgi:hypothetical protein
VFNLLIQTIIRKVSFQGFSKTFSQTGVWEKGVAEKPEFVKERWKSWILGKRVAVLILRKVSIQGLMVQP